MATGPSPTAPAPPFGALLRRHRLAAGLSQEQLAERAGVSARAISDLEGGRRLAPYPHTVQQLAKALRLSPAERTWLEAAVPPRRDPAPPAQTEPRPATNLPAALTSFVGRATELDEVRRLLATTRLLTLTGAGGVGKTRLALEVARAVQTDYPDGVWLVELAALADPGLVPQAAATMLGVREEPGRPLAATLANVLRPKRLLLALDNCEHLLDACARLADALLRACPALRILATSREALGIGGETTWRVPSLALPDTQPPPPLDQLAGFEAVHLFVDRAAAALPSFRLTDRYGATVAEICRRLDGIPLAIELAAARVAGLPPEQIAERLDDRFRLLSGGSRAALPRQQTLRATVAWSHDLLTESERVLFRRLAVFAGGWTIEAAEAVGAGEGIDGPDVLDLLLRLVGKSLVQAEERGGEPRYGLLETVRQYAAERLAAAGEAAATRARHAAWCLALAERAEPALHGPEQIAWLDRLAAEHDNLRAALAWCLTAGEPGGPGDVAAATEAGLRLAGLVWWFWFMRAHWREGVTWLDQLLGRGREPTTARAEALAAAGQLYWIQLGDAARGRPLLEEGAALYRRLDERHGLARALNILGRLRRQSGRDYARGAAELAEALRLARATSDPWLIARVLVNEAGSADMTRADEARRAQAAAEEGLALCRGLGDTIGLAMAHRALGRVALHQGDYGRSRAAFEADLAATRALGDHGGVRMGLRELAKVALARGDPAEAAAHLRESLELGRRVNLSPPGAAMDLEGLAGVALATDRPARAAWLLGAAGALRAAGGPRRPSDQRSYEAAAAAARAALGAAAFVAAWAEGEALSPDEAAAQALADAPEVGAGRSDAQ